MKYKWYRANFDRTIRAIADGLQGAKYSDDSGVGFELIDVLDNRLNGRYIERIVVEEMVVDPYGIEHNIETVRYNKFKFSILMHKGCGLVKLVNPPRATRTFFKIIQNSNKGDFFVEPFIVSIHEFIDKIRVTVGNTQVHVPAIIASGISLNDNSSARIEIRSRKNAYTDLKNTFKQKTMLEKVKLIVKYNHCKNKIDVSRAGGVSCSKEHEELVDDVFLELAMK